MKYLTVVVDGSCYSMKLLTKFTRSSESDSVVLAGGIVPVYFTVVYSSMVFGAGCSISEGERISVWFRTNSDEVWMALQRWCSRLLIRCIWDTQVS